LELGFAGILRAEDSTAVGRSTEALLDALVGKRAVGLVTFDHIYMEIQRHILKVVVVGQLVADENAVFTSKQSHAGLAIDDPFLNPAVWRAGMVDKAT
jgi:hypothetical protein